MKDRIKEWGWRVGFAAGLAFHPGLAKITFAEALQEALNQRVKKQLIIPLDRAAFTGGGGGVHYHHLDFAPRDSSTACPAGQRVTYLDQPVRAMMSGVVTMVGDAENRQDPEHSRVWLLDPEDGTKIIYEHLDNFQVEVGDRVQQGDPLAFASCEHRPTTRTTGVHVDIAWIVNDREAPFDDQVTIGDWEPHEVDGYYAGYLQRGNEFRWANTARCTADTYKNSWLWNEVCDQQRNDLEAESLPSNPKPPLPVPVPTPRHSEPTPTPKPKIEIPDIIIIPNTPTPEPTKTPVPAPTPRDIPPIELGCVQTRVMQNKRDKVPAELDSGGSQAAFQSYEDMLCSTQGNRDSEEGLLMIGDFEEVGIIGDPVAIKAGRGGVPFDTHQIRWFSERRNKNGYRLVNGQAFISKMFILKTIVLRMLPGQMSDSLLRYQVEISPRYIYKIDITEKGEDEPYPNLPEGDFSPSISEGQELYPFNLEFRRDMKWHADFDPAGNQGAIRFPLGAMKKYH